MWKFLAEFIFKYRIFLLSLLFAATAFMGYQASKVEMSYDFTNAIPTDNPKHQDYLEFINTFGEDGNTMVLGIQTSDFFNPDFFLAYTRLSKEIGQVKSVENVLDITAAVNLKPDSITQLRVEKIFPEHLKKDELAAYKEEFLSLPFYKGLLYNPETNAYLMAIRINKETLASKDRTRLINEIIAIGDQFGENHHVEMHYSGLPQIRTQMANKVEKEIKLFLMLSFLFTAIILFLFFRSITAVIVSMLTVAIGVVFSFGTLTLLGYKITLLTGMIPPLVVVVGIPNCIYFLNKYHTEFGLVQQKVPALKNMVGKMGIVTLFTNLTTAIGFGVFFFTKSVILREFGLVAGLNIMGLFIISLILIPALYSFLPSPKAKHTGYLENKWINKSLSSAVKLVFRYRGALYVVTMVLIGFSLLGILRLKAEGHILDDLPHSDKIYTDLKFFEKNFKGVMPLEIMIDTKKKYGALTSLNTWENIDEFTSFLESRPEIGAGLTLTKGIKFARQGFSGGDESEYLLPDQFEFSALRPQLISMMRKRDNTADNQFSSMLNSFVDTNLQVVRLSVNVADIGSVKMPELLSEIEEKSTELFDQEEIKVTFTGASITFLEGSKFIIHSLRDSLILAFTMILVCMFMLFRDWKIVMIAIVTNIIPLAITAGIMGWMGILLKPSTVLVFSVALGITTDVTIRFLVNFRQDLAVHHDDIQRTVLRSIRETGLSIIFTSLILIAGFTVFTLSDFQGTKSLGFLTSLTLLLAMLFNLSIQPALLLWLHKVNKKKNHKGR